MCARIKWLFTGNYGYPAVPVTDREAPAEALWDPPRPYQRALILTPEAVRARDREKGELDGTYKIDKPLLKRRHLFQIVRSSFNPIHSDRAAERTSSILGWYQAAMFCRRFLLVEVEMEAGVRTRVFEALVHAGWEWRNGALYAPRGTMWLDGKEPWGGDIRSFHERMVGRVVRLKNNPVGLSGTEATDLQRAVLDVEGPVDVLEGLLGSQ